MHPQYEQWLRLIFDHEVKDPHWWFDLTELDEVHDEDAAALMTEAFTRSGKDLCAFSDEQVDQGIWYLCMHSDYMYPIRNGHIPPDLRLDFMRSIHTLYRDCFAARCSESLGHMNQIGTSALNSSCYMFWDMSALAYMDEEPDKIEAARLVDTGFATLENIIRIPHRACIEGGLHGLGHAALYHQERVRKTIATFLQTAHLDAALRNYAERAGRGAVM